MARITISEFFYWLREQDKSLKVLVVEGDRDSRLWSIFVPETERKGSIVLTIGNLEIPDVAGGNRGRAVAFAGIVRESDLLERVLVLIDADNDYILGNLHEAPTQLTDFRDIEAYAGDPHLVDRLGAALGIPVARVPGFMEDLATVGVRIGCMHAANERLGFGLPLHNTLHNKSHRYLSKTQTGQVAFDEARFLNAVFSEGRGQGGRREQFEEELGRLSEHFNGDARFAVRGKHACLILSKDAAISYEACTSVFMSIILCSGSLLFQQPALATARDFLTN